MYVDIIIVGQGLAGSLLAWRLLRRKQKILIIDPGFENASKIAAGLINPITGPRLYKAGNVEQELKAAKSLYHQLELIFKKQFYIEKTIWRYLRTENDLSIAHRRVQSTEYQSFVDGIDIEKNSYLNKNVIAILKQTQTGYLLTRALLTQLKEYFISLNCYRQEHLDYRDINLEPELSWQAIKTDKIIFCEGFYGTENPWFSYLPFQPVKGEILTLETEQRIPDQIINDGKWMLPLANKQLRIGATFERNLKDTNCTLKGKSQLLNDLKRMHLELKNPKIIEHHAHVRPCTKDRQLFLGRHPYYSKLYIFNGFGAKGSLQIPWYSELFAAYLTEQSPLPPECDINRI